MSDTPQAVLPSPCGVTPQPDAQGAILRCWCGNPLTGKQRDYCSRKCKDVAYNAAHPVSRQRPLDFAPPPAPPAGWTPAQRELSAHLRKRESRKARMLARLQQGEATTWELMQVGGSGWRSRLQELREDGHRIPPAENRLDYAVYRLEAKP